MLAAKLEEALEAAEQLRAATSNAFPKACAEVEQMLMPAIESLGTDAKLALGNEAASQLFQLSMTLAPGRTLDHMESVLEQDTESRNSAAQAIAAVRALKPAGPAALD
jgi:diadenosine tetraphosphate (Ap4A) HIT family hydrolase